jgi:hypothetical protein
MGLFELEAAGMRLNVGNPAAEFRPVTGEQEILSCNEYPIP